MRQILAFVIILSSTAYPALAQEVLVSHHEVLKKCKKLGFIEKVTKEGRTPEGQAIIAAAASYLGVNPSATNFAVKNIKVTGDGHKQDTFPFIPSPAGYTICSARPSNLNTGAGQLGIETHGDTTFNSTIIREANKNGLQMYMVVPCKATTDTRIQAGFDVTFVKAEPDWEKKYPKCMPSRSHPWLARNNRTTLNVLKK